MPHPASCRLFVAKLPPCVKEDEFRTHFGECGELTDAYMPKEKTQQHFRGIGFVTYASLDEAERVVKAKHRFHGHQVIVDFAAPKVPHPKAGNQARPGSPRPRIKERTKKQNSSEDEVFEKIQAVGGKNIKRDQAGFYRSSFVAQQIPLISSDIWCHTQESWKDYECYPNTCTSPRSDMGGEDDIIVLESLLREMAQQTACSTIQTSSPLSGCETETSAPMSPGSVSSSVPSHLTSTSSDWAAEQRTKPRVYVGRLPEDATAVDLGRYFRKFGEVSDVYIPRSRESRSKHRGFGFVSFTSREAIEMLIAHGPHELGGLPIILDYSIRENYSSKNMDNVSKSE